MFPSVPERPETVLLQLGSWVLQTQREPEQLLLAWALNWVFLVCRTWRGGRKRGSWSVLRVGLPVHAAGTEVPCPVLQFDMSALRAQRSLRGWHEAGAQELLSVFGQVVAQRCSGISRAGLLCQVDYRSVLPHPPTVPS